MAEVAREVDLFRLHPFHRWFTATGRAPTIPEKKTEKVYIIVTCRDVGTSLPMPIWQAANATVQTLSVNLDPDVDMQWTEQTHSAKEPATPEVQEGRIEEFLEEVYTLAKLNDAESATDRVFDYVDKLLCDSEFVICDEILKRVDVEKLPTALMRSFLTITNPAKDRLPSRKALYLKIDRKMVELKGENKARRIIGRLA